jgi:hypothetical protein
MSRPHSTPAVPLEERERHHRVLDALRNGPKSSDETGCSPEFLRQMEAQGLVEVDPDRFPDEYVPGNPFIARLPGDKRPWHWRGWRV